MIEELASYIATEWKIVLGVSSGLLVSTVATTWAIAKLYYTRQIEISKSENEYLQKKLSDKDAHMRGVMEVMGQRLLLAEEEPKKLKAHIKDTETQIETLKQENDGLLEKIADTEKQESFDALYNSINNKVLRHNLRGTVQLYSQLFERTRSIRNFTLHFNRWDASVDDEHTNAKDVAKYYSILSNIQLHTHKSLDIKFFRSKELLRFERAKAYSSLSEMLAPFLENESNQNKNLKMFRETARNDIEYYIALFGVQKSNSNNLIEQSETDEDAPDNSD
ncbi:MAG: hypothetical protein AAF197_05730 [Pseudomonadota bacterium]